MTFQGLVELARSQTTKLDSHLQAGMEDNLATAGQKAIKVHQQHRTPQDPLQAESEA
jgi:hypothetical protein